MIHFIICFLSISCAFSNFSKCAYSLFKEHKLIESYEKTIETLESKESVLMDLLKKNKNPLKTIASSIRSFEKISFSLFLLDRGKESVQSLILLAKFFPLLKEKVSPILPVLQSLTYTRKNLIEYRKLLDDANVRYDSLIKLINLLIAQKYKTIKKVYPIPVITDQLNLDSCIGELIKYFPYSEPVSDLSIKQPTFGQINYKENKFFIKTKDSSYVFSPWDALVVNIILVPEEGYRVILKQGDYFLILSGLESIICEAGEKLKTFEPIGQIYGRDLSIELRKKEQIEEETYKSLPPLFIRLSKSPCVKKL